MTESDYKKLNERVVNGKAWVEKIKAEGTYSSPENENYLKLWFKLGNLLMAETAKRNAKPKNDEEHKGLIWFQDAWHSKAWVDMKGREAQDENRRAHERQVRADRAERKRLGDN